MSDQRHVYYFVEEIYHFRLKTHLWWILQYTKGDLLPNLRINNVIPSLAGAHGAGGLLRVHMVVATNVYRRALAGLQL
jgi:hypothetical protein